VATARRSGWGARRGRSVVALDVSAQTRDEALDGGGIVGGRFSIADIALFSPLASLPLAGEAIDAKRFPRVAGYFARLAERPAFGRILAEEDRGTAAAA
jgi:glutathione S-transferase